MASPPSGQADGMNVGAIYIARIGQHKIERTSVNSVRYQQHESYQRRSGAESDSAEHERVRRH